MKKAFLIVGIIVLSILIGGAYAFYDITTIARSKGFMQQNGCWRFNPVMDLEDKHQRALIAKVGLFALRESEVLYFVASEDSDGNPLNAQNDYVLEGNNLDARYWSYTMYGHDYFLVPNDAKIYGYNLESIKYLPIDTASTYSEDIPKSYQIHLSSQPKGENWLPSGNEEQFHITLRMYQPAPAVYENPTSVSLPTIKKI